MRNYDLKTCAICGHVFFPTTGYQMYCGRTCQKEAARRKAEERKRNLAKKESENSTGI